MHEQTMRITYASGLKDLVEKNSSFDSGILRVAYTGRNRNNSFISKETFERCIPTIYNCPIVCRYDRITDSIGSHDMELLSDEDGSVRLVNITQPVGVVPESANYWWEDVEDISGVHEYLCIEVLIWKRQEAYRKIKEDGITDESMEITVKEGAMVDGVYVIERFEFTAFCLLGSAEPCFESASLEMFSAEDFQQQLANMMKEFKESFSMISTPNGAIDTIKDLPKGGDEILEKKMELLAKFGMAVDELDFNLEDISEESLEDMLKKRFDGEEDVNGSDESVSGSDSDTDNGSEPGPESNVEPEDDGDDDGAAGQSGTKKPDESFALLGQFMDELYAALESERIETCFGEMPRYCYVDCDQDLSEVYCYDMEDWKLYGFHYLMQGDNVIIEFDTKTRKKFIIVDFDDGEQSAAFETIFKAVSDKYRAASETINAMNDELGLLRQYKADTENAKATKEREDVFARFSDLVGIEAFDQLREACGDMSAEVLEEKCYAIRGKFGSAVKFSMDDGQKVPKLKVEKTVIGNEPYGGVFTEYGIAPKQ